MKIGRKIYYLKQNGHVLVDTGEMLGDVRETTQEEDFNIYEELKDKQQDAVGCIKLEYGQLVDKFSTCTGYSVDITKNTIDASAIIFSFTTPEASLEQVKTVQKSLIEQACSKAIIGGFKSTAYKSIEKTYGTTLEDQANITGNALSAVSKVAGVPECQQDKFYYHAQGEEFTEWQASECLTLARDFKIFKETQLIKNKQIQAYIDTLTTVEEVQKVTWDTVIPS